MRRSTTRTRDVTLGQGSTNIITAGSTQDNLFSNLPLRSTPVYMREYYDLLSIDQPCSTDADCRGVLRERLGPGASRFIAAQCADNMSCHWTYYPNGRSQSAATETTRPRQVSPETEPSGSMVAYAAAAPAHPQQDQQRSTQTKKQNAQQGQTSGLLLSQTLFDTKMPATTNVFGAQNFIR